MSDRSHSLAGSLIAVALLETLLEKGTLTREEVANTLERARTQTGFHTHTLEGQQAADTLADLLRRINKTGTLS